MKDQILQASPDVQVGDTIDGVEHPDPRMRPARLAIRISALLWERVRRHLERCQSSPAERMLWEQWLSPQAVAALLRGGPPDLLHSPGNPATHAVVPEPASRRLRETIVESLKHPLALQLDPEPAGRPDSPAADPTYLLILTNGATLVLRITNTKTDKPSPNEMTPARLDDCFFTRAAADFARPAGDLALAASSDPAQHRPASVTQGRVRDAVVREWVGRYALVTGDENSKGLVPPDRPCDVNGASLSHFADEQVSRQQIHFIAPTDWGFSGGPNGCLWVGYESPVVFDSSLNSDSQTLRRLFAEGGEDRTRHSESSHIAGGTSTDSRPRRRVARYPLPLSGNPDTRSNQTNGSRRNRLNDALACIPELARAMEEYPWAWVQAGALNDAAPASDRSFDGAAYRSAIALGRCRLLGSARADIAETTLAPACGMSAARELTLRLSQWARQAKSLPGDLRGATAPRASDLCMGVLEARLEAWAAYLSIDESYAAALDAADASAEAFSQLIDEALDGLAAFDDAIQWAEPLVASVVAGPGPRLLENWKKLLAAPYRQSPPWWLDCVPRHATLEAM